jgi:hypothetical protein
LTSFQALSIGMRALAEIGSSPVVLKTGVELLGLSNDFLPIVSQKATRRSGEEIVAYLESTIQFEIVATDLTLEAHLADRVVTIAGYTERKTSREASTETLLIKVISGVPSLCKNKKRLTKLRRAKRRKTCRMPVNFMVISGTGVLADATEGRPGIV